MERSQEEKVLGGLSHVAAYFHWIGVVANVVLLVIYREKSKFVYDHAKQGLGLSVLNVVVSFVLGLFGASGIGLLSIGSMGAVFAAGMVWILVGFAWGIVLLVLVIMGAIKGFSGQEYQYPLFGEAVSKIGDKAA
jgi:uncharacterized Tic20 family protein